MIIGENKRHHIGEMHFVIPYFRGKCIYPKDRIDNQLAKKG